MVFVFFMCVHDNSRYDRRYLNAQSTGYRASGRVDYEYTDTWTAGKAGLLLSAVLAYRVIDCLACCLNTAARADVVRFAFEELRARQGWQSAHKQESRQMKNSPKEYINGQVSLHTPSLAFMPRTQVARQGRGKLNAMSKGI